MNNPFNPDRFLYQDSENSVQYKSSNPISGWDTEPSSQPTGCFPQDDHPTRGILLAPSTRATQTNDTVKTARTRRGPRNSVFFLNPRTLLSGLCVLLIAVVVGGLVERSSLFSTPAADVPPDIKAYIDQAILRLSRDSVGLRDFALYANGGRVIRELTGVLRDDILVPPPMDSFPNASIVDDIRVGNCWKFPGEVGQLGFRTSEMLYPTYITVDHIPLEIAADIGQAPRSMALWAAIDGSRNSETLNTVLTSPPSRTPGHLGRTQPRSDENLTFILLTAFTYDIYSVNNIQTFPIVVDARIFFGVFVLDILSNWGGEGTCLYRVRIHGEPASL